MSIKLRLFSSTKRKPIWKQVHLLQNPL